MTRKLFLFPPAFGLPNASPFCMKLETYLRMTGLPYQAPLGMHLLKAPKKKLPYIEDDGKRVADSGLIIEYLKTKYGDPLDAELSPRERAQGHAIRRLIEESLYWPLLWSRWVDERGWKLTRPAFFGMLPPPLRWILPGIARRAQTRLIWGQGTGRHSPEEIYRFGTNDLDALAELLGDRSFFLGEKPTSVDATAHAFLANILWAPVESPLKSHAATLPNLEHYCARMRDRYFT